MPQRNPLRLETYLLAFVVEMVAKGRFSSHEAMVQAGLRLLEESESRTEARRCALQEGEDSGWTDKFSLDDFLAELHKQAKRKKVSNA
jgi:antitoxin ParD1/3/4